MAVTKKPETVTATVGAHHMILDDDDLPPIQPRGRIAAETEEDKAVAEYIKHGCRGLAIIHDLAPGIDEESRKLVSRRRAALHKAAKKVGYKVDMRFENRPTHVDKPQYNKYVWKLTKMATENTTES